MITFNYDKKQNISNLSLLPKQFGKVKIVLEDGPEEEQEESVGAFIGFIQSHINRVSQPLLKDVMHSLLITATTLKTQVWLM